jgi:hypothetical protein
VTGSNRRPSRCKRTEPAIRLEGTRGIETIGTRTDGKQNAICWPFAVHGAGSAKSKSDGHSIVATNPSSRQATGASVPDQALAVPATPLCVDGPSGFDPSRERLAFLARAVWLAGTTLRDKEAIWLGLRDRDREPYYRSAIAVVEALHELGRKDEGGWCPIAARAAQVEIDWVMWALGQKTRPLHDSEVFIACLAPFLASAGEADRPKRGATRGSVHEHAVGAAETPKGSRR